MTGLVSGGVRYGEYTEVDFDTNVDIDGFHGWGPVVGIELNRCIGFGMSLYILARETLLFGDIIDEDRTNDDPNTPISVTEIQLGIQLSRSFNCIGSFFIRGGLEAQYWAGTSNQDSENFGLVGGTLALGLDR